MKKYNINGTDFIKLSHVCEAIRYLRRGCESDFRSGVLSEEQRDAKQKAYTDVVRLLYQDELRAAASDDEREDILETTGDFIISRRLEGQQPEYFGSWTGDGKCNIVSSAEEAMSFLYEGVALLQAAQMNRKYPGDSPWTVHDIGEWNYEQNKRLLSAIFDED